jgi:hypothetical protein
MFATGLGESTSVPMSEEPNQHCCSPKNTQLRILQRRTSKKLVNGKKGGQGTPAPKVAAPTSGTEVAMMVTSDT